MVPDKIFEGLAVALVIIGIVIGCLFMVIGYFLISWLVAHVSIGWIQ